MQNGLVESFIGRLRDECLNAHLFAGYARARRIINVRRIDDNSIRPRSSLDGSHRSSLLSGPEPTTT